MEIKLNQKLYKKRWLLCKRFSSSLKVFSKYSTKLKFIFRSEKGFKSEWATVKNEILYVGSMGKEWTTDSGEFQSNDPQYIKTVTVKGEVIIA